MAVDPARLDRLLDLAGDGVADELLDRLRDDLGAVASGLAVAVPGRDIAALRAQTHVLVSLAGAVGAEPLQHLAEALNEAAHSGDSGRIDALADRALPLLHGLIAHVGRVRAGRGAAP